MNEPTVRLVADIPKNLKKKLMTIALEKDTSIKQLITDWLESLSESNDEEEPKEKISVKRKKK
jgi:hypothetical protein